MTSAQSSTVSFTICGLCGATVQMGDLCSYGCPLEGESHEGKTREVVYVAVEDFQKLGAAFAELYSQALNGVVCDPTAEPGRHGCRACLTAWEDGREVLKRYDEKSGNLYRPGPMFQPGVPDA